MPYRRRLTKDEQKQVRKSLFEEWNFQGDYWDPIEALSPRPVVFLMKDNVTSHDYEEIISEIQKRAEETLFEITEDGSDAEIAIELFHPSCYETIYCDKTFEWIVYGSHEGTIAFGGGWLLEFVKQLYADRHDLLNKWEENG